jgi:hypothetical protein
MSNFFLFLRSLFGSWMVWAGGILRVIPFAETLIEPWLRSHPKIDAWFAKHGGIKRDLKRIALLCLAVGCYRAWVFEHDNAQAAMYGKDGKSEAWARYNQCDKERAVNDVLEKSCSTSLTYQQSRNDGQQDLFNRCLLALGLKNKPEPVFIKVSDAAFNANLGTDAKSGGKELRAWVIAAFVNRDITPFRGTFRCAGDFVVRQGRLAISNASKDSQVWSSHRLEDGGYRIESVDPATWRPDNPLLFIGISAERPTGCKFKMD